MVSPIKPSPGHQARADGVILLEKCGVTDDVRLISTATVHIADDPCRN
jgi:hypothetical protein